MELETAAGRGSKNATEADIIAAFRDGFCEYLILQLSSGYFIQTSGEDDSYVIEYREGDDAHHFRCDEVAKATAQSLFIKYLNDDLSWKTDVQWRPLVFKPWWKLW